MFRPTFENLESREVFSGEPLPMEDVSLSVAAPVASGLVSHSLPATDGLDGAATGDGSYTLSIGPNVVARAEDRLTAGTYGRGLTADFNGANPVLYAITPDEGDNRLVTITDTGAASTGTVLASAGVNQSFRGIRFGPTENAVVLRPTLLFSREANDLILNWNAPFILQSATNVTGAYADVLGATSPYTNSLGAAAQLFFRLRN